jgi:hypothetical protein
MARCGFAFVSDDWTYLSYADGQLAAWGLGTPLKLLPDAAHYFPELRDLEPGVALNGERSFEVDPEEVFGVRRSLSCEPRRLVFLERQDKLEHTFVRMPPQEAARRLGSALERLPRESSRLRDIQRAAIQSLVERECWVLRYGENPRTIAQALDRFSAGLPPKVRTRVAARNRPLFVRKGADLTRRLTPTPLVADLSAAECAIRLETNNPTILRLVGNALSRNQRIQPSHKRFLWRLISDDDAGVLPPRPSFSSVSADGMQVVNMGQRSFMAMDAEARYAVGFLAEEFLKDGRFEKLVLARLLYLTAGALRWKPNLLPNGRNSYE